MVKDASRCWFSLAALRLIQEPVAAVDKVRGQFPCDRSIDFKVRP
jgi:hypothetical protein